MTNETKQNKKLVLNTLEAFNIAALFVSENKPCNREKQKGVLIGPAKNGKGSMFYGTDGSSLAMVHDEIIECDRYWFVRPGDILKAKIEAPGKKTKTKPVRLEIENGVCTVFDYDGNSLVIDDVLIDERFWNVDMLLPQFNKHVDDFQSDKEGYARDDNAREDKGANGELQNDSIHAAEMRVPIMPFFIDARYYGRFAKVGEILAKADCGSLTVSLVPLYKKDGQVYFTMSQRASLNTLFVVSECRNTYKHAIENAKSVSDEVKVDYEFSELN